MCTLTVDGLHNMNGQLITRQVGLPVGLSFHVTNDIEVS